MRGDDKSEIGHYVVTAHPSGSVLSAVQCSFLSANSRDVVIAKSTRIEIRQYQPPSSDDDVGGNTDANNNNSSAEDERFPLLLTLPINGRIASLSPIRFTNSSKDCLFFTTERGGYALISYDEQLAKIQQSSAAFLSHHSSPGKKKQDDDVTTAATSDSIIGEHYPIRTHASGLLTNYSTSVIAGGRRAECGPLAAVDPLHRCIALHLYDGFVTVIPIHRGYDVDTPRPSGNGGGGKQPPRGMAASLTTKPFGDAFHTRIEQRTVLSMTFLKTHPTRSTYIPQLALLYQDARGFQHVISHGIELSKKCMVLYGSTAAANADSQNVIEIDGKPAASVMPPPGEQLKKSRIEGGSAMVVSVPPAKTAGGGTKATALGGVLILGQRQITYHSTAEGATKVLPIGQALLLSCCPVVEKEGSASGDEDMLRYLLGDENGRIHLLVVGRKGGLVTNLHFETLGTASVSSALVYLGNGMVFVGSQFANSQLVQILDNPVPVSAVSSSGGEESEDGRNPLEETTYLQTLEEYTNLGPIVDFDLRPTGDESKDDNAGGTNSYRQSVVVTCSGVAKDGTVRLVRNGVGMKEQAEVEMEGIKGMWSLRRGFDEHDDTFLVQSFVRETRILGVQSSKDLEMDGSTDMDDDEEEEEGGALAEVTIGGFNSSKSTLFAGNVSVGGADLLVQVVEDGVRVVDSATLEMITDWSPFRGDEEESDDDEPMGFITVASSNESGQIVVALRGGTLVYLVVESKNSKPNLRKVKSVTLEREISCIDLRPFESTSFSGNDSMDIDGSGPSRGTGKSHLVAVGLWDDFSVRFLDLNESSNTLDQLLHINLGRSVDANIGNDAEEQATDSGQHMMARSLCLVTMESQSTNSSPAVSNSSSSSNKVDMLFVGLGDGKCISFGVTPPESSSDEWLVHSRKEVSLGTQGIHLVPFQHGARACVLATGDRPTIIYLTGGNSGSNSNPKLCYSTISLTVEDDDEDEGHASHRNISVNVATPFRSSLLFSSTNKNNSSLCVADENTLRLGMIDDIQKLHVTSYKLGMTPRRIAHHEAGRVYCVGCIGGAGEGAQIGGEANMGNCVRFFDDSTFEEVNRIDLEPFEMILDVTSVSMCTSSSSSGENYKPFILIGTAYSYPDEDEPSQGRVLVVECNSGESGNLKSESEDEMVTRFVRHVTQMPTRGGVYSITPFYGGTVMITVNSKTHLCKLNLSDNEIGELTLVGAGHHGHMISLYCKSLADEMSLKGGSSGGKQLAIVGDLMRSISLVEYLPKHQVIEELARDYNSNFCTSIEMLTDNIYLGSENFANLFVLRHNADAPSEEARVRLDTVGEYHLGEMINTMKRGSLVMPSNAGGNSSAKSDTKSKSDKSSFEGNAIEIAVGSQTLFGTVDGTIGSIMGLGGSTFAFLGCLQRAIFAVVRPVGDLSHERHRHYEADGRVRPSRGFIDGDLVECFLDLNRPTMERIVKWMNDDGRWRIRDDGSGDSGQGQQNLMDTEEDDTRDSPAQNNLSVEDVLTAVEEISMLH
ncbi:hypothetical protein ACHAWT_010895 [Skeletonema menzelii]